MEYQKKLDAVKEYLRLEFPGCQIEDQYDSRMDGQRYKIQCDSRTYGLLIKTEFLEHFDITALPVQLSRFTLVEHLKELPDTPLIVGNSGLSIDYD